MIFITEQVRFVDTDMMGVVHHSNFFRWFEVARVAYLKEAGVYLTDLMNDNYLFPISDVRCSYKEPARYDDILNIYTKLVELTKAKMVFSYSVRRACDDALLAEGFTCNVFTTKKSGKVTRLPDKYFLKLKDFAEKELLKINEE